MAMEEREITAVARILADWNPLGENARNVTDLDGYRTEAIDIIGSITLRPTVLDAVRDVLNGAFELSLRDEDCAEPAKQISKVVSGEPGELLKTQARKLAER